MERADPREIAQALTRNVLTSGELSVDTRNLLRRANLLELYEDDPELALVAAHRILRQAAPSASAASILDALTGLAEASFLYASESGDARYYLTAALYAWTYLFQSLGDVDVFDSRTSLAAALYNRALILSLAREGREEIVLSSGRIELPFGVVELEFDEAELQWGARRLTRLAPVSELRVKGMRNRYRTRGLGAAVAASTDAPSAAVEEDLVSDKARIPATVLLVFDDLAEGYETGVFRAHLEVHPANDQSIEVHGQRVPLEVDITASIALMMTEAAPWKHELAGFFEGDLALEERLMALSPHQPGRIPVVLVHGTASSVATWANFLNDLIVDPEIQRRYEFLFFTYNTGAPIAYSAWRLRRALDDMIATYDPEGTDPALRRAIVMGHSQGGLLTKLLAVDSGNRFWSLVSDEPFEDLDLHEDSRVLIEGSLFFEPHPAVERVVFIATPHRGSFLAAWGLAQWVGGLVRAPANVVLSAGDLATRNPEALGRRRVDAATGSVAQMSPSSDFVQLLAETPVDPGIRAHSIIAMRKLGPKEDGSDGVVRYESAHLEGVDSEVIVESGHSCLSHPDVVREALRILRMHVRYPTPR